MSRATPLSILKCWFLCQSCADNHTSYEFMNAMTVSFTEDSLATVLPNILLLQSFYLFPQYFLSLVRRVYDIDVLFRAENFTITFLPFDQLWISVLSSHEKKMSFLGWGLGASLISEYKGKYLKIIFILCPLSKVKVVGSPRGSSAPQPQVFREVL